MQSYYNQQKLVAVGNFVQLKWKYIPTISKIELDKITTTRVMRTNNTHNQIAEDESDYIPIFVKKMQTSKSSREKWITID